MNSSINECEIYSSKVFNALSYATDIFERNRTGHGKRVAYTSVQLAKHMKLSKQEISKLCYAALLHDIGVGNAMNKAYQLNEDYKEVDHVTEGSTIVMALFNDQEITEAVLNHHENFDGTGLLKKANLSLGKLSKIIRISDYLDNIFEARMPYSLARKQCQSKILSLESIYFEPELVDSFIEMTSNERFWLDYRAENFKYSLDPIENFGDKCLSLDEFIEIGFIFSKIVDNKSKHFKLHSENVAFYMRETARMKMFDEITLKKVYLAGLFHDIGNVSIMTSILEKPGSHTEEELDHIKTHPYYTRLILEQIPNIRDIINWASRHHEYLDGTGYPERLKADSLDYFSRLLAVCDIYDLLIEERHYREHYSYEDAWKAIFDLCNQGKLCREASNDLKSFTDSKRELE